LLERRRAHRALVAQPSRWVYCEKAVTLHILAPQYPAAARPIMWVRPTCSSVTQTDFTGRLALVSRGHPDPDPEWTPDRSDD
jgi:hypothetical protein